MWNGPARPSPCRDLGMVSSASHLLPHGHAASPGVLDGTSGQCASPATAPGPSGHIPYRYPRSPALHPGLGQHPQRRSNNLEHAASSPSAAGHKAAAWGGQRRWSDVAPVAVGDAVTYPTPRSRTVLPQALQTRGCTALPTQGPGQGFPPSPHDIGQHFPRQQAGSRELLPAPTPGTDSLPWQPAPLLVPAPLRGDAALSMSDGAGWCGTGRDGTGHLPVHPSQSRSSKEVEDPPHHQRNKARPY